MKKNITIGIIGCGYWGTIIIKTLIKIGVRKIIIYDKKKPIFIKKKYNFLKISSTYSEFLNEDVDFLYIAVHFKDHFKICSDKLENLNSKLKAIVIEKPFCKNINEIKKLIYLSNQKKITLFSGYVYNYDKKINLIKNLISKGFFGKIISIFFERSGNYIRKNISCFDDLVCHDISTIYFWFKTMPKIKKVSSINFTKNKNQEDYVSIAMKLKNFEINLVSGFSGINKVRKITILGSKKCIEFDESDLFEPLKFFPGLEYDNFESSNKLQPVLRNKIKFNSKFLKKEKSLELQLLHILSLNYKNKASEGGVDRRANYGKGNYITDANHALRIKSYIEKLKLSAK